MKTAVILFNLGGPTDLSAVKPFLFNLFSDPAIINFPQPFRFLLAKLISGRRHQEAKNIYKMLGGKSPLLEQTKQQEKALNELLPEGYKVFTVMRHWHPRAQDVVNEVLTFDPENVILLPLYPQNSTTTTTSSLKEWLLVSEAAGLKSKTRAICCYPLMEGLISYFTHATKSAYEEALQQYEPSDIRVLFTAHGLPEKIVKSGDPYQKQVEQTVAAITKRLPEIKDTVTCYQSRVGPLKWIGPSTDEEIVKASQEKKGLVVVPISFVSEHSETLVELDMEYKDLATKNGCSLYLRVATPQSHPDFIKGLAGLVFQNQPCQPLCEKKQCPRNLLNVSFA